MCLALGTFKSVKAAHSKKPQIAKEDIVVYKVLRKSKTTVRFGYNAFRTTVQYVSPHRGVPYIQNTLFRVQRFSKTTVKHRISFENNTFRCFIHEGIHAYTPKKHFPEYHTTKVCIKMIIPKGTKYYVSEDGTEIVSLALKTPKIFRKEVL